MLVFRRIEAVGYRCLKEISQELNPFEILVGPNGSGKSAFLDTIHFLADFARYGIDAAVNLRAPAFQDLVWLRSGNSFRFDVEVTSPVGTHLSYGVSFALDKEEGMLAVRAQELTPQDAWLLSFLRVIRLDPKALAGASSADHEHDMVNTGASLPWQIRRLQERSPQTFEDWISHIRTALPDVCEIESTLLPPNRHVSIRYQNGVQVPAWALSEGTLRLLALTILAYIPDFQGGVYLIEEPENGVHPAALETIYQSLSSVYDAQVLVSTHSPVLLSMAKPEQILCFSKTPEGTKIIRGNEHPALEHWQGEVSLGTMIASGILS